MEKCIIAAVADNLAIGKDNALLWHISEDLKYFRRTTSGYPVIMGRRTFESIGRPLPGRMNIAVSRSGFNAEGLESAGSLSEAFSMAEKSGAEKCFVIGGGDVYRQALPVSDRLYITFVHTEIGDADTFFPEIDMSSWKEEYRSEKLTDGKSGLDIEFAVFRRI